MAVNLQMIAAPYVALALQLIYLGFSVVADSYIRREQKVAIMIIDVLAFGLLLQNYMDFRLDLMGTMPYERTLVSIFGYCVRPVILVLFFYVVDATRTYWIQWALIGI